jgi:hypothetical protein
MFIHRMIENIMHYHNIYLLSLATVISNNITSQIPWKTKFLFNDICIKYKDIVEETLCDEIHFYKLLRTAISAFRCALSDETSVKIIYFTDPTDSTDIPLDMYLDGCILSKREDLIHRCFLYHEAVAYH